MDSNLIMVVEKSENDIKLLYAKSIINRIECKSQDELLNQEFKRYILNFYNILEQYDIKEGSTEISNSNGESVAYDPSYLAIEFSIFLQDYMVTNSVDDINLATL
ncbi:MAG: hypothetical protein NTU43_04175 [Bacteroidetes bacterium]|nr:hypothetical protein [Bacteroidota bacterium]